jgi:hypothetical protein
MSAAPPATPVPSVDGSLKVILAIASITDLVTVNLSTTPPTFKPANLDTLALNDAAVGISDEQMPIFRANLREMLPQIASAIDQIPDNASATVDQIAEVVNTALMGVS